MFGDLSNIKYPTV